MGRGTVTGIRTPLKAPIASSGPRLARQAPGAAATLAAVRPWRRVLSIWLLGLMALLAAWAPARADAPPVLRSFELSQDEDGLNLGYALDFELSRQVEEALLKGVPIYFVARAEVFRTRWYWRDKRVGVAERNWRLAWQPLTRRYRLSQGSLSQNYDRLDDALAGVQRATRWKIADAAALEADTKQYVEFSFRLDTSQLPRPLQIGVGGQQDWNLAVERLAPVPAPEPASAVAR